VPAYATDGYLLYDEEGRVIDVNGSVCEAYGYSRDELPGRPLFNLSSPSNATVADGRDRATIQDND
jgi:PAS domain S-box-containing protein